MNDNQEDSSCDPVSPFLKDQSHAARKFRFTTQESSIFEETTDNTNIFQLAVVTAA